MSFRASLRRVLSREDESERQNSSVRSPLDPSSPETLARRSTTVGVASVTDRWRAGGDQVCVVAEAAFSDPAGLEAMAQAGVDTGSMQIHYVDEVDSGTHRSDPRRTRRT
jgi:hypothetical protein